MPVRVSPNLLKNTGFEKGVKHWRSATGYPVKAQIKLDGEVFHGGAHSIMSGVTDPTGNAWDVQLSQSGFEVQGGTRYHASFMAKSVAAQNQISAAVINTSIFALAGQKTISPTENWGLYEFDFTPSGTFAAAFNVDMGGHTGSYYLDDFVLTTLDLTDLNLVKNPDFFDGDQAWILTTLSAAVAEGTVRKESTLCPSAMAAPVPGIFTWDSRDFPWRMVLNTWSHSMPTPMLPGRYPPWLGKMVSPGQFTATRKPSTLTTTKQTYSFTFPMNEPTDLQSRLGFDIGGDGANVYFDNILLRKGDAINTTSSFSDHLLQSSASLAKLSQSGSH